MLTNISLRQSRLIRLIALATIALASLLFGLLWVVSDPLLFNTSTDVGWHWLLAGHYGSRPIMGPTAQEVLDVMGSYPPASHIFAGLLSQLSGISELRSINIIASLCVTAIYLWIFWVTIKRKKLIAAVTLLAGVVLLTKWRIIIGHELIENYFYAQVVATFVAVFGLNAVFMFVEPKRFLLAALLTFLLGFVFPAIAIVVGASYGAMQLAEFYCRRLDLNGLVLRGATLVIVVLANPYFWPMITNATHEGYITVRIDPWVSALGAACLMLLISYFIRTNRYETERPDPLFYLAAGFCITTILQYGAWLAGFGGRYAVSKYSFGLGTFGLYAVIVIAFPSKPRRSSLIDAAVAVIITAALFTFQLTIFRICGMPRGIAKI